MGKSSYTDIVESLNAVRKASQRYLIEEEGHPEHENPNSVPYTKEDEFMTETMEAARQQFGADFSDCKSPMAYDAETGDVTFSGDIPSLNGASFQFRLLDSTGNGCYLFTKKELYITDENLRKLNTIYGVYKNWKEKLSVSEDRKPMSMKNKD